MSKDTRHRVWKHRMVQRAQAKEIEEIEKLISDQPMNTTVNNPHLEDNRHGGITNYDRTWNNAQQSNSYANLSDMTQENGVNEDFVRILDATREQHELLQPSGESPIHEDLPQAIYEPLEKKEDIIGQLKNWAVECNVQQNHLDKLLNILRRDLLPDLPKSSKTFLGTEEAQYDIIIMKDDDPLHPDGEFVYFGIAKNLERIINPKFHQDVIKLLINIDGMPLTTSGTQTFWPILCKVYCHLDIYKPFAVAIYSGKSKPKSLKEYLKSFIEEMNKLLKHGIIINECTYKIDLMGFVADTPARAFLKCVKGHGGYSACERCTIPGEAIKIGKLKKASKIIYDGIGYPKRTKASFIAKEDHEHHTGTSRLLKITPQLDLTKIFVLDHMHLLFNGVMKRLIHLWMQGPLTVRLSPYKKIQISRRLLTIKKQIPSEFQRKTKSIKDFHKWKATEFRFFLLYCGPIVLKKILSTKLYDHFLLLHVACRILCSEELAVSHHEQAKKYFEKFVLALPLLYGRECMVINMHNLLHVADDVGYFNCTLTKISCFPFENCLGGMKRTVRTPNKPLSQVCRRLHEKQALLQTADVPENKIVTKLRNKKNSIVKIKFNFMNIGIKIPDNMVLLKNNIIMEISGIYSSNNDDTVLSDDVLSGMIIEGRIWRSARSIYNYPCKSKLSKTWKISLHPPERIAKYPLTYISEKLTRLQLSKSYPNKRSFVYVLSCLH